MDLTNMSHTELEAANQALMRDRDAILGRQRAIAAELDRRSADRERGELLAALARLDATDALPEIQHIDAGHVASVASVLTPGDE